MRYSLFFIAVMLLLSCSTNEPRDHGTLQKINEEMKRAAAEAIAACVKKPTVDMVVPKALDRSVAKKVAKAVADAAKRTGVIRKV